MNPRYMYINDSSKTMHTKIPKIVQGIKFLKLQIVIKTNADTYNSDKTLGHMH